MDTFNRQLNEIEKELEKDQNSSGLWMENGIGKHLSGDLKEAVESFKKSLELDPKSYSCHYNLANSLMELQRIEEAIHHYMQAITLKADHIPSLTHLADAWEMSGQPDKAMELYDYLTKLKPDDPLTMYNKGNFQLRQNRHIEAAACYQKVVEMDKEFTEAYYHIAWILMRVEAVDEAVSWAEQGLATDPEHEELQNLLQHLGADSEDSNV